LVTALLLAAAMLTANGPRWSSAHAQPAAGREMGHQVLRVRNRTPFIVEIYVGGLRVGWLRPYRSGVLRGLRRGHHRLYAHTRWGTMAWGPRSMAVPGTWSLNP
jgi:hypothetical protein